MSSKVNNQVAQVNSPDDVRNVVLIGTAGSGKTSLFEQLLRSRVPGYRGEKDSPERLSQLYLASLATGDVVVNLLDAPGHPDFVGELRAGMRAADAAVFVLSAADGIDPAAQALWEECRRVNLPRVIALTKMDAAPADFDTVVEQVKQAFGEGVLPTHVPVGSGANISGTVGVHSRRFRDYSGGGEPVLHEGDDAHDDLIEPHRGPLVEGLIQEAEDDDLMERYLEGDDPGRDALLDDLMKATAGANLFPVVPVTTSNRVGTEELLSLIEHGFPTPSLHPNPELTRLTGDTEPTPSDPAAPLVAQVIRTTSDPFAGKLSMVRIFSGTLRADAPVHVSGHRSFFTDQESGHADHDDEERVGQIQQAIGTELVAKPAAIAGEIVMVPKLTTAETGDTITDREHTGVVANWPVPEPLLPLAIKAATRNDEDKLASALQRLAVEDSTVRLARGASDQLVLWTTGQAHADLVLSRLKERYGVNVAQEDVKIDLRETFVGSADALGRHVKQSGGHGQYAVCNLTIEPLERGAGFEFVDKVVGGSVPRQFIPSVEKGVQAQMQRGVLAGYPMTDVRVTLYDGKSHSVDSSDMAFQMAGAAALKEAASDRSKVALLEPLDEVTVTVGDAYLGAVMTDLSGRRGQVLGTDAVDGRAVIRALVPQSELARYAIDLRGIAHGGGTFTRAFHGYELMPAQISEQYLAQG
ncbi:elongation factor G-like protein EF-G2 [Nigerium massiliense]|uniref:elongation factor G-like protein EF-G2 n=1 Tax=Nigerium massiliense TaxID=1522317 RepID=UPI00058B548A|nr:elongation factor G-like protein EF-G2 [Nigerium massiliense]